MTDHAHELRRHANKIGLPAGDTPAVMQAAAAHIEHLERELREKQEPIAWYCDGEDGREYNGCPQMSNGRTGTPLYAAPPVTAPVRAKKKGLGFSPSP